jgi:excisionase family DNA binding protein
VLDVNGMAALLGVSVDTVYDLLKSRELPGRKVGRKWLTTRAAVMRGWRKAFRPKPRNARSIPAIRPR